MHPKSHLLIPTSLTKFLLARRWLAPALALAAMVVSAASASAQSYFYYLAGDPSYQFTGSPPHVNMAAAIQTILGKPITSVGSLVDPNSAYPTVLADSGIAPFYTYGPATNGVIKQVGGAGTVILTGIVRGDLLYIGNETACTLSFYKFILRANTPTQ